MSFSAPVRDALVAAGALPAREDASGVRELAAAKGWFQLKTNGAWYSTFDVAKLVAPLGVTQPITTDAEAARGCVAPDDAAAVAYLRERKSVDTRSIEDGPNGRVP